MERDCAGKRVLEYGCGTGSHAFALAERGAQVWGIDISREGIRLALEKARALGVEGRVVFQVMDAEALDFPDGYFDLICGSGILHHLHLQRALKEITRVLRLDGRAVFFEPLGHNPLINLYRRLTPGMRSPDERPLRQEDLERVRACFAEGNISYFHLSALAAAPLIGRRGFHTVLRLLERVDRMLFRLPLLRRQAWIAVLDMKKPLKN